MPFCPKGLAALLAEPAQINYIYHAQWELVEQVDMTAAWENDQQEKGFNVKLKTEKTSQWTLQLFVVKPSEPMKAAASESKVLYCGVQGEKLSDYAGAEGSCSPSSWPSELCSCGKKPQQWEHVAARGKMPPAKDVVEIILLLQS